LTKTVKPKIQTSTFWCLQGFFPISEEGSPLLFRAKGDTHPEPFEKGEGDAEDWGKRELPGSMHKGLLVTTAVQV
jgi:hypothetical protein